MYQYRNCPYQGIGERARCISCTKWLVLERAPGAYIPSQPMSTLFKAPGVGFSLYSGIDGRCPSGGTERRQL